MKLKIQLQRFEKSLYYKAYKKTSLWGWDGIGCLYDTYEEAYDYAVKYLEADEQAKKQKVVYLEMVNGKIVVTGE
jgi:hypothetical protein